MKSVKMPVGKSGFEKIRNEGMFYIDKSGLIEEIIKSAGVEAFLFTRPRRFGKTLNMSMLSYFFDISKDSRKLFEGLKIAENKALCDEWMNRYPTIFVSFKNIDGLDFNAAFDFVKEVFFNLYNNYLYLLDSDKINDALKDKFNVIFNGSPSITDMKNSLNLLINMLYAYYGKKVILLIDEYDVPIDKANANGYYEEMLDLMRGILQVLKDNDKLQFSVITGCLRIAKESIFTGLNNLYTNTIISCSEFREYFGFTEAEVTETFGDLGLENKLDEAKKWYDGYHFGDEDIYCPWDVIYYLRDLLADNASKPRSYWANTSGNKIVETFVENGSDEMMADLNCLLAGDYIIKRINENITYDSLYTDEENIWNVLLMTGYLTPLRNDELTETLFDGEYALKLPNNEIRAIFADALKSWISRESRKERMDSLKEAIWNGDEDTIGKEITKILNRTLSFNDLYHEYVYHLFLAGLFLGLGYRVDSNKEYGMGRPDIVVLDRFRKRAVIFEIKNANGTADGALKQIAEKRYEDGLDGYKLVSSYAIRFDGKTAEVKLKDKLAK